MWHSRVSHRFPRFAAARNAPRAAGPGRFRRAAKRDAGPRRRVAPAAGLHAAERRRKGRQEGRDRTAGAGARSDEAPGGAGSFGRCSCSIFSATRPSILLAPRRFPASSRSFEAAQTWRSPFSSSRKRTGRSEVSGVLAKVVDQLQRAFLKKYGADCWPRPAGTTASGDLTMPVVRRDSCQGKRVSAGLNAGCSVEKFEFAVAT